MAHDFRITRNIFISRINGADELRINGQSKTRRKLKAANKLSPSAPA